MSGGESYVGTIRKGRGLQASDRLEKVAIITMEIKLNVNLKYTYLCG